MKQPSFGIIRLIIVLAIIGILGAIAVSQYNKYMTKARVADDMGGPTAWLQGTTDKVACWDAGFGESGGWVEGTNEYEGDQQDIRNDADSYVVGDPRFAPGEFAACSD